MTFGADIQEGSKDGRGAGDHDTPFEFGHWRSALTTIVQGRLTILRGDVRDKRRTDRAWTNFLRAIAEAPNGGSV